MEMVDADMAGDGAASFKEKIMGILQQGDFAEKRGSKLSQVDFFTCCLSSTKLIYISRDWFSNGPATLEKSVFFLLCYYNCIKLLNEDL